MMNPFPFRLGTTSFILRDDLLPNVEFLKDRVQHVELLLFETDESSNYPSRSVIRELKRLADGHDLSYTVHLPIGVKLGSPDESHRRRDVESVLRAIDATAPLEPLAWDLHLEQNEDAPHEGPAWQAACIASLRELKAGGAQAERIGIETLEFDYASTLPVLDETGFGTTLDIGHVWYCGFDESTYLERYLPRAISFHMHGFDETRDHKGLQHVPTPSLQRFVEAVAARPDAASLPVSIEVFSEEHLSSSMEALHALS